MTRVALGAMVALAVCGAVLHVVAEPFLLSLATEDGPLEVVQAVSYLLAAATCAWGLRRGSASAWAWAVALAALLMGGEEISWGQRLIGFGSPERVADLNRQGEFNVHNLAGVHENLRDVGVVLLLLGFVLLPVLVRRSSTARRLSDRFALVLPGPLSTTTALLAVACMRIPRWLGVNDFGYDEVGELFLAWTVLAYAARVATARRQPAETTSRS